MLFIYYPSPEEPLIGLAPSGGLASHINARRSWLHAIDELFERDAVNLRWHGRVPLDRIKIDVEPRDPAVKRALDELADCAGAPQFFLQSLDVPEFPVVTAIQFDRWLTELSYNAGGGVGPTVEAAMRSALGEYCQSERSLRIRQVAHDWQFSIAFDRLFGIHADAEPHEFSRFVQAIAYYGYAERVDEAAWYFEDGGSVRLSELHAQLDELDPRPLPADGADPAQPRHRPDHVRLHAGRPAPHEAHEGVHPRADTPVPAAVSGARASPLPGCARRDRPSGAAPDHRPFTARRSDPLPLNGGSTMPSIPHQRVSESSALGTASMLFALLLAAAGARFGVLAYAFERLADRGETDTGAWAMLGVHTFGTLLIVGLALILSRPGMLTGLAFACYSTVAIGLNAPNELVAGAVWVSGIALVIALAGLILDGAAVGAAPGGVDRRRDRARRSASRSSSRRSCRRGRTRARCRL